MRCRYCITGAHETQEHLEECEFTRKMRTSLNLKNECERMIQWRNITRVLKELYKKDDDKNNSNVNDGDKYNQGLTQAVDANSSLDMSRPH